MASKVNLKKYVQLNGKWQFVSVLKIKGKPTPGAVLIDGEAVTITLSLLSRSAFSGAGRGVFCCGRPACLDSKLDSKSWLHL